jgi:AraC-like DNA-binding protein
LAEFRRVALSLKLDPVLLMRRAGVDLNLLRDPDLTLPMHAMVRLLEITAATSGVEDFGLRLAEDRGLPDLGPLILMICEAATVRDALNTLITHLHLHSDAICMSLDDADHPIVTVDIIDIDAKQCRQALDISVASITSILRWLLGPEYTPVAACFTHGRPVSRTRYERFFRCPLAFLSEFNGLLLRKRDLDQPCPAASPVLRRQVTRYIESIERGREDGYVQRVTQLLAVALPKGEAKAEQIAGYLGVDTRTLHRRLSRFGTNYSAVLETVRKTLAAQHLAAGERPISDIAGLIGFSSLSAFSNWFRRAFGEAPRTWRSAQRPISAGLRRPRSV